MYGVRECSNFILSHIAVQFSQHCLLKRLSFPHSIFLPLSSKMRCPQVRGCISGLSLVFHWPVFLLLCQDHTVLMTYWPHLAQSLSPSSLERLALLVSRMLSAFPHSFTSPASVAFLSVCTHSLGELLTLLNSI